MPPPVALPDPAGATAVATVQRCVKHAARFTFVRSGEKVSGKVGRVGLELATAHDQECPRQAQDRPDHMPWPQLESPEDHRRQQDDEQGPEVVDEIHLDGGSDAEGREKQGMITKDAPDPNRECL